MDFLGIFAPINLLNLINNYESKESACLSFFEEMAEQIFKIVVSGESYGPPLGPHVFRFLNFLWGPRVIWLVVTI